MVTPTTTSDNFSEESDIELNCENLKMLTVLVELSRQKALEFLDDFKMER